MTDETYDMGFDRAIRTAFDVVCREFEVWRLGSIPTAAREATTAPVAYWTTSQLENTVKTLLESGAQMHQDIHDVGGGMRIAIVRDPSGNLIGLREAST